MSWWDIGNDMTGDTPADIMRSVLLGYAQSCDKQSIPRPDLQNVLNAVALAISKSNVSFEDVEDNANQIVLRAIINTTEERLDSTCHKQAATPEEASLAESFFIAIKEIESAYMDSWQRQPRIRELLYALEFILGYKPSRFIDVVDELEVDTITEATISR